LLKNEGQVNQDEENQEQLLLKLAEKREEINRLEEQLEGSLPKGRDITNERAARLLEEAVDFLPRHTTRKPPLFLFTVFLAFVVEEVDYVKYGFYLLESIVKEAELVQAEFFAWEDSVFEHFVNIAKVPNPLPYPVIFGSTGDIYWSSFERKERGIDSNNQQNSEARKVENKKRKRPPKRRREKLKTRSNQRIVVSFKGFGEKIFKVQCDRRQLPAFRQFLADWETLQRQKKEEKFSLGLFALRSAYLIWKPDEQQLYKHKKPKPGSSEPAQSDKQTEEPPPWKTHRLYLHCVVDPRLLTAEGTEEVRQEKIKKTEEVLEKARHWSFNG
jgi:hypothetical protein